MLDLDSLVAEAFTISDKICSPSEFPSFTTSTPICLPGVDPLVQSEPGGSETHVGQEGGAAEDKVRLAGGGEEGDQAGVALGVQQGGHRPVLAREVYQQLQPL